MVTTRVTVWIGAGYSYWQKIVAWLAGRRA